MDLVSWVFSREDDGSDQPLLLDAEQEDQSLTYLQLRSIVKQFVAGMDHEGIKPGDCVLVNSFANIYFSPVYLGIIGSGAVFTGVNPGYTSVELVHHMKLTKPSLLIVEPELLEKTVLAAKELGISTNSIFVFDHSIKNDNAEFRSWRELLNHGEKDWRTVQEPKQAVAQYASTSGTSGLPKAARISHAYIVAQAEYLLEDGSLPYEIRRLTALPPFHAFGAPIVPASIRQKHPLYIMRRFEMEKFLQFVHKFRISETYLPPPVIVAMPRHPLCTSTTMQSIRQIWFGGAMLKYSSREPLYGILHEEAKIQPVWGMTETGWITAGWWNEKFTDESVGRLLERYEAKVVDEKGDDITESGSPGELVVSSPTPTLGYIDNPAANEEIFDENNWIRTGDIGYIKDGRVFVIDRKKDIIKVRTWQVSPAEIEAALLQHPKILDVAVIGVSLPQSGMGEIPRAFIVLQPGAQVTAKEIKKFAETRLARYKVPQEFVFTDMVPKNPTGKILRRLLREQTVVGLRPFSVTDYFKQFPTAFVYIPALLFVVAFASSIMTQRRGKITI